MIKNEIIIWPIDECMPQKSWKQCFEEMYVYLYYPCCYLWITLFTIAQVEAINCPPRWMKKHNAEYTYNGILFRLNRIVDTCYYINETWRCYMKEARNKRTNTVWFCYQKVYCWSTPWFLWPAREEFRQNTKIQPTITEKIKRFNKPPSSSKMPSVENLKLGNLLEKGRGP